MGPITAKQWGPFTHTVGPDWITLGVVLVLPFTGKRWSVQFLFVRFRQ